MDGDNGKTQFHVEQKRKPALLLYFLIFVTTIGGPLLYGWHLGVLNNSDQAILQLINSSIHSHYGYYPTNGTINTWFTMSSTFYVLGGILGAALIGIVIKLLGRRKAMFPMSIFGILSTILMCISEPLGSFEILIVSRFLIGIHGGVYMGLSPMYISECSPAYLRGTATIITSVGITFGVLLSSIFGLNFLLGDVGKLAFLFAIPLIFISCHFLGIIFCPESPRLLIEQNRMNEAINALSRLRDVSVDDVSSELDEIQDEFRLMSGSMDETRMGNVSIFKLMLMRRWRMIILAACVIMGGMQLCGINGIIFYSKPVFLNSGMNDSEATYGTLGISVALFAGSLIAAFLVDRRGRKPLLAFGFLVMGITSVLLVPLLKYSNTNRICAMFAIVCNVIFNIAFSIGPGGIGWMITPEMFPFEIRGKVCSFVSVLNWICNVVVVTLFPLLTNSIGSYTFLIFAILNIFFLIFTLLKVQETKEKTPAQIEQMYNRSIGQPLDM